MKFNVGDKVRFVHIGKVIEADKANKKYYVCFEKKSGEEVLKHYVEFDEEDLEKVDGE